MITEKRKPPEKYRGLSHSEIIERQRKELHDIITSPQPSTSFEKTDYGERKSDVKEWSAQLTGLEEAGELEKPTDATTKSDAVRLEDTLYQYGHHGEALLDLSRFILAGMGKAGKDCGKVVLSDVDITEDENDIRQVKFRPLNCSRIECPECYWEWAIRQTFDIALKVEAMAKIRNERPFHVIFSVHPSLCEEMTWTNVNQSLWRRGVRRLKYIRCQIAPDSEVHKHKIEDCPDCHNLRLTQYGGIGIFHPLRVKAEWKSEWGKGANATEMDDLGSARYWEKIRANIGSGLGKLEDFAKIGFHAHNWVFTDHAEKQTNEEYLIKFAQNFKRFNTKEVVALTRYLVTHTATIRESAIYRNHVCNYCGHSYKVNKHHCGHCGRFDMIEETHVIRNRIIHPIRSYGLLHRFDPKKALIEKFGKERGIEIYHDLAHKIAELLYLRNEDGETITMVWNEATEELEYPASAKEIKTSDEHANWISVWKLFDLVKNPEFMDDLSLEKREFVEDLLDYLRKEGKPPPIEECGRSLQDVLIIPDAVDIVEPIVKREKPSPRQDRTTVLRKKIVELIRKGEDDVFKLDICLADVKLGSIMKVVNLLCEDGTIIKQPDGELVLGV